MAGWLVRLASVAALAWIGGFVWFVVHLPAPAPKGVRTDGIVVLTGGPGRIARGIELMEDGAAERLLISGVDPSVRPRELAAAAGAPARLFACCVDLGFVAVDTRGNAEETAAWVKRHRYRSVRLVTAAYHSPRAEAELAARVGGEVRIVPDPVPAGLPPEALAREYTKYVVRLALLKAGLAG